MARVADDQLPARVRELVTAVADEFDAVVLDVEVKGQAGRRVVRIVADTASLDPEAGLDVDLIARLSRRCGETLDEHDLIVGAYTLEVTSPGADRPLRSARDFARNTGRTVRLFGVEGRDDTKELSGVVAAVTDDDLTLEVDGDEVRVSFADLDHGKVVLPW